MSDNHVTQSGPAASGLEAEIAAQGFAALGSEPRLQIVRALVRAGPDGLMVGALQDRLGYPASTLSHHVKILAAAGLLSQQRQGRALICRAVFEKIVDLAGFLTRECCIDMPDICARDIEIRPVDAARPPAREPEPTPSVGSARRSESESR